MNAIAADLAALDVPITSSAGQDVLHPSVDGYLASVRQLFEAGFSMCVDLTVVDHLHRPDRPLPDGVSAQRFELVVNLLDLGQRRRVRLLVQVADGQPLPTLTALHPGTEAMEREAYDMFGLVFEGHPDLTRILMPDTWVGHPLRKDFATGRIPVQFKGAPQGR